MTRRESSTSTFISAPDGLKLHAAATAAPPRRPCRSSACRAWPAPRRDFEALAEALSRRRRRRVIALDYRGRGQSDYDRDPANYSFQVELADVIAVLTALECQPAVFIGTSRGGILTMLLAALRPSAIAGVVLNDIGPVIEPKGLMRIKGYVGKLPQPRSYEEARRDFAPAVRRAVSQTDAEDWLASAHRTFKQDDGRLVPDYDVALAKTLEGVDFEKPLPPLWPQFDALANVPVMVIRGANSDLLSEPPSKPCARGGAALETLRSARSGPCAAAGRGRRDCAHRRLRRALRWRERALEAHDRLARHLATKENPRQFPAEGL